MRATVTTPVSRRLFLGGAVASSALLLPGCAQGLGGLGSGLGLSGAVRRLLEVASSNAFSRLTMAGGFWDSQVSRLPLPDLFTRGAVAAVLRSQTFKDQLQRQLNEFAVDGARRAAPLVTQTIRTVSIPAAVQLLRGGPTDATSFLRNAMGPALINAMIPALGDAMNAASNPLVNQAIGALSGVNVMTVAQAVANSADNAIWYQIGQEETNIRANPSVTNDPLLIAALKRP
ncbi:DUF4197 domain-containing protein [Parablastomonas sp. CN1-191]|uniref:DUF4197 domain-containing protein n=1 Tax=Parablastomonas sp. CN1-191 TaxID=3400908 RepID=UPI003BF7CF6A